MKQTNYILKIDNPCNENWTLMTTIEQGKYCSVCSKNLIDFTSLSDATIIGLIEKSNGKVCGRFNEKQLNRIIEIKEKQSIGTGIYKLLTGLIFISTTNNIEAKNSGSKDIDSFKTELQQNNHKVSVANDTLPTDTLKNLVSGKIIDIDTKEPLAGAIIQLKGESFGTKTDINGFFKLTISEELLSEKMVFQVLFVGYTTNEFTVHKKDLPIDKELLILPSSAALLGEVVVIKQKGKWWQRKKKNSH